MNIIKIIHDNPFKIPNAMEWIDNYCLFLYKNTIVIYKFLINKLEYIKKIKCRFLNNVIKSFILIKNNDLISIIYISLKNVSINILLNINTIDEILNKDIRILEKLDIKDIHNEWIEMKKLDNNIFFIYNKRRSFNLYYYDFNFKKLVKIHINFDLEKEFLIISVKICNNILVCLNYTDNKYFISYLKFNSISELFKENKKFVFMSIFNKYDFMKKIDNINKFEINLLLDKNEIFVYVASELNINIYSIFFIISDTSFLNISINQSFNNFYIFKDYNSNKFYIIENEHIYLIKYNDIISMIKFTNDELKNKILQVDMLTYNSISILTTNQLMLYLINTNDIIILMNFNNYYSINNLIN